MAAYLIARIQITDSTQYKKYVEATPTAIGRYGGKFIVRGGTTCTLEGPEENRRVVVIEFPDVAQAKAFWSSPEYLAAKKFREGAADGQFILVEGVA